MVIAERVCEVMQSFRENGKYSFEQFDIPGFSSTSLPDAEIPELLFKKYTRNIHIWWILILPVPSKTWTKINIQ